MNGAIVIAAWLLAWGQTGEQADFILLDQKEGGELIVEGRRDWIDKKVTYASTFKTLLAQLALREGVAGVGTEHFCADPYLAGGPRNLNMKEAMYFSSNDYFVWLATELGKERIEKGIVEAGLAPGPLPEGWLKNWADIRRGGELQTSPKELQAWTMRIATGKGEEIPLLHQVMEWPSGRDLFQLCGKTGTWGGAAWFTGFGRGKGEPARVVTVLVPYEGTAWPPAREKATRLFYERFGLEPPK